MVLLLSVFTVSASETTTIDVDGFNFISWFKNTFNINSFSVVGDFRQCSNNAVKTIYFDYDDSMTSQIKASNWCSPPYSLVDIFDQNWNTIGEWKNSPSLRCGDRDGCIAEIYCCPRDECSSNNDCPSGSLCKTKQANDPNIIYRDGSNFRYCSDPVSVDCWYNPVGSNSCSIRTYLGQEDCPSTYIGRELYESKSNCINNIDVAECSSGQKSCDNDLYRDCINEQWTSWRNEVGECGYTEGESDGAINDYTYLEISDMNLPEQSRYVDFKDYFSVRVKNTGDFDIVFYVEAGFYTKDYSKNVAQLYSTFPIFSTTRIQDVVNCVEEENFVTTKKVTLKAGDSKLVELSKEPLPAYISLDIGEYILKNIKLDSFIGIYTAKSDGSSNCAVINAEGDVVEGTGGYIDMEYYPNYYVKDITNPIKSSIICGGEVYGLVDRNVLPSNPDTVEIKRDYKECITPNFETKELEDSYEANQTGNVIQGEKEVGESCDLNSDCITQYCDKNKWYSLETKCQPIPWDLADKTSLTREQISESTTSVLIASACLDSKHCIVGEGYEGKCIPLSKLRDDGVITKATEDKFFSKAGNMIDGGIVGGLIGGGGGLAACLLGVGAGTTGVVLSGGTAAPIIIPAVTSIACSALIGGGATVGAVVGARVAIGFNNKDEIVKYLKAEDDSAVGLCVAEKEGVGAISLEKYFGWAGFIPITGDKGVDGLIIILGLFSLGVIIIK